MDKPQSLWWRKALFQVHLWTGVILSLYVAIIGITGSLLVFKLELAELTYPKLFRAASTNGSQVDLPVFMDKARAAYPKLKLITAYSPSIFSDNAFAFLEGPGENGKEQWLYVLGNPQNGDIVGSIDATKSWLTWVGEIHIRLLGGQTGFIVNGIGAIFLVLLCITGIVLWWPGISNWTRAVKVSMRSGWKRINFDLHSAVGFWTLSIVFLWSISVVYFVWPKQIEHFVSHFSSAATASEPEIHLDTKPGTAPADVRSILARAQAASPQGKLAGIYLPEDSKEPIRVYMARGDLSNFSNMDYVYFHPVTGEQLAVWHAGINPTWGSKLLFWLGPLHFGMYWGMGIKILWALLGLSLPALAVTGVLMYWNRSLSRYWRRLRSRQRVGQEEVLAEVTVND